MSLPRERPAWHERAACLGLGPELFYPESERTDGRQARPADYAAARALCAGCPVREPCAQAGEHEPAGMWGGVTLAERRARRRRLAG